MHFYQLKEGCSTSSLQIEAEYNQRDAKVLSFYYINSSNGTKICFLKLLKIQDQDLYLKYIFLLISYLMAKIKPNEKKTENNSIRIMRTLW